MTNKYTPHKQIALFFCFFLIISFGLFGQVGIGNTNPNDNALLEIGDATTTTKGLLLPRVDLANTTSFSPMTAHIQGMVVYNKATVGDVTPGYYYNDGSQWVRLAAAAPSDDWSRVGNSGTASATNFLGTIDNQALRFRTVNTNAFEISGGNAANRGKLRAMTDGTAALPVYSWDSDQNIGMYRIGADILGFSTAGIESMRILADRRVAINTTAAVANTRLTVTESGGNRSIFGSSASGEGVRGEATAGDGVVGIGTTGRGVYGQATSGNGVQGRATQANTEGGYFLNSQNNGFGLAALGGGTTHYSFNNTGTGAAVTGRLMGTTSIATATNGEGIAGIGDDLGGLPLRPLGLGIVGYGYQAGVFGDSGYYGQIGVYGSAEGNPGLSNSGTGVYGENVGGLGAGVGGASTNIGVSGYGAYGGVFEAVLDGGYGILAANTTPAGANRIGMVVSGQNVGITTLPGTGAVLAGDMSAGAGFAKNTNGTGLIGVGNNITTANTPSVGSGVAGTGNTVGVYGKGVRPADGIGMVGLGNNLPIYTIPGNGAGVAGTGVNIGVFGHATDAAGFGIYSSGNSHTQGNVTISGNINVGGNSTVTGTKSFIIDDPRDPANKYLKHFSVESNEILNIYRGVVAFDATGEAVVQLPDYYDAINKNATYQLTPIGASMPNIYIASEVSNGSFKIAGGVPGKKTSWTVTAERNDLNIRNNPELRNNVVDKGEYRNRYLAPEAYGQPADKGILSNGPIHGKLLVAPIIAPEDVVIVEQQSNEVEATKIDSKQGRNLTTPLKKTRSESTDSKVLRDVPLTKAQQSAVSSKVLGQELNEKGMEAETSDLPQNNSNETQTPSTLSKGQAKN
ncbi:hypothetical protein F3C99_09330 [Vitellibacter sp. q18]|nr:hypothetical protein [Aequorivita lutea]